MIDLIHVFDASLWWNRMKSPFKMAGFDVLPHSEATSHGHPSVPGTSHFTLGVKVMEATPIAGWFINGTSQSNSWMIFGSTPIVLYIYGPKKWFNILIGIIVSLVIIYIYIYIYNILYIYTFIHFHSYVLIVLYLCCILGILQDAVVPTNEASPSGCVKRW